MQIPIEYMRTIEYEIKSLNSYLYRHMSAGMGYFSEITPHIYVCNDKFAKDVKLLLNYKIKHVYNLSNKSLPTDIQELYKKKGVKEYAISISDDPDEKISNYFDISYNIIHNVIKNKNKILLYSHNGMSRPIIIIANYLLRRFYTCNYKTNENLIDFKCYYASQIVKFIKNSRICANPNNGFVRQLIFEEYKLKTEFETIALHALAEAERIQKLKEKKQNNNQNRLDSSAPGLNEDDNSSIDYGLDSDNSVDLY